MTSLARAEQTPWRLHQECLAALPLGRIRDVSMTKKRRPRKGTKRRGQAAAFAPSYNKCRRYMQVRYNGVSGAAGSGPSPCGIGAGLAWPGLARKTRAWSTRTGYPTVPNSKEESRKKKEELLLGCNAVCTRTCDTLCMCMYVCCRFQKHASEHQRNDDMHRSGRQSVKDNNKRRLVDRYSFLSTEYGVRRVRYAQAHTDLMQLTPAVMSFVLGHRSLTQANTSF